MNMFQRAFLGLNLNPAERAFMRFVEDAAISALIAAVVAVVPYLETQQVNWRVAITVGAGAFALTLYNTISKYLKAHGDAPLSAVVSDIGPVIAGMAPVPTPAPAAISATPSANIAAVPNLTAGVPPAVVAPS